MPKEQRYHCNNCNTSYSVTVGTIFHKTKLELQKWFLGISLILNAKKGISARQLARHLDVNKNTAWQMLSKLNEAIAVVLGYEQLEREVGNIKIFDSKSKSHFFLELTMPCITNSCGENILRYSFILISNIPYGNDSILRILLVRR